MVGMPLAFTQEDFLVLAKIPLSNTLADFQAISSCGSNFPRSYCEIMIKNQVPEKVGSATEK